MSHNGLAIIDIISPCVTFNNADTARHSYGWSKENETPIHDITYVPLMDEITVEDFEEGDFRNVTMHDGSVVRLKKLDRDYDPTDRISALRVLEEASAEQLLLTGLIYYEPDRPSFTEYFNLPEQALNRLTDEHLRPSREQLAEVNAMMF